MSAAQTFYGINIAWGLGSTTFAISGATGIYQSTEHELKIDEWEGRDQRGNVVSWAGYNPTEACTIEYLASDASAATGSATLTYPDRAAKITITADGPISGTGWIVQSTSIRKTNTDATKITVKATRYLAIS